MRRAVLVILVVIVLCVAPVAIGATTASTTGPATGAVEEDRTSSGTLTLVLASEDGLVVAADSRGTSEDGSYQDTWQKIFRAGPTTAVAIAGFAVDPSHQFSAVDALNERFGADGIQDSRGSWLQTGLWLGGLFRDELWRVAAMRSASGLSVGAFVATVAGFEAGVPTTRILDFQGTDLRRGARGEPIALYEASDGPPSPNVTMNTGTFLWVAAGIRDVAASILMGQYPDGGDPAIRLYYEYRHAGMDGRLSIAQLKALTLSIFRATMQVSRFVGGPVQMGVFPLRGPVEWIQPFPIGSRGVTLFRRELIVGAVISANATGRQRRPSAFSIIDEFSEPVTEPWKRIYAATEFQGGTHIVDGNYYVGDRFKDCTFIYGGGRVYFIKNRLFRCSVGLVPGQWVPRELRRCRALPGPWTVDDGPAYRIVETDGERMMAPSIGIGR